jgi:hypothetical protein
MQHAKKRIGRSNPFTAYFTALAHARRRLRDSRRRRQGSSMPPRARHVVAPAEMGELVRLNSADD